MPEKRPSLEQRAARLDRWPQCVICHIPVLICGYFGAMLNVLITEIKDEKCTSR
jgi:hypothetical protein